MPQELVGLEVWRAIFLILLKGSDTLLTAQKKLQEWLNIWQTSQATITALETYFSSSSKKYGLKWLLQVCAIFSDFLYKISGAFMGVSNNVIL